MTVMKLCALSYFLFVFISKGKAEFTSVIETHNGPVRGEILSTVENSLPYAAFKGIPYAKPPLGNLRFKPPVEKEPWKDVLDATKEGSVCTQYNNTVIGSEDCLYLNVFTPHTQFDNSLAKPVMVWIHGGAYRTGNSNASYYGPDFLLEEDVIVVSLNYRLGALGFLNLNHENATGNCGLKDQNFALKWVQKNIANFGGDPKQVTIFGQSAGSVSVDLHVLSDMSSGLFKQSISMSGSTLCLYWGIQSSSGAEEEAFSLGARLGKRTSNKDELLETLVHALAYDIVNATKDMSLIPFRPTIESTSVAKHQEKFLTQCSLTKYLCGNYNKGPHLMGFTSAETVAFAGSASKLLDMVNTALGSVKTAALSIHLPFLSNLVDSGTTGILNLTEDAMEQLIEETSDIFFVTGIDTKQRFLRVHNKYPIYYYRFTFDPPFSAHRTDGVNLEGAGHEDELPYIFYRPHIQLPLNEPKIKATRERLTRMWTNFAKYSNPTPPETSNALNVIWPDSSTSGHHLEIGEDLEVKFIRPTDKPVEVYQTLGLGASPILNDCPKNISPTLCVGQLWGNLFNYVERNLIEKM